MDNKIKIYIDNLVGPVPENCDRNITQVFYYDESNNAGKIWLKPNDKTGGTFFNADLDKNFVIAGIVTSDNGIKIDKKVLYKTLNIPQQAPELKFDGHFAKENFLETISRPRTFNFLQLIDDLGVDIHVTNINNLYYGVVDIVDAVIDYKDILLKNPDIPPDFVYFGLKELLYDILHANLSTTERLFARYHYPNIKDSEQADFCDDLITLLKMGVNKLENTIFLVLFDYLVDIIDHGKDQEMIFLKHNEDNVILKEYFLWYLRLVALFPKSRHIFDKNNQISREMGKIDIKTMTGSLNNYEFVDSKDRIEIQLSDVISGLYGQLYTYANKTVSSIENLNETQIKCLKLLYKIQTRSHFKNIGYFYSTVPCSFSQKVSNLFKYVE